MSGISHRRLFYLDSAKRVSGSDASNCAIAIQIPLHETFTHVCVMEINIPKSYYLVQAGYNTFQLTELGTTVTVTVPPGNYGATSFRTTLVGLLNAASPNGWTYAISFPPSTTVSTGKYTYTVSGNSGNQPTILAGANVYEQLGFDKNSTNPFAANTITSKNVIKMQSEDALYLHSDMISPSGDDILQEVYTNSSSDFSIINYKCSEWQTMSKPFSVTKSNLYRFSITDENGVAMNLNGLNWVATIMLFTEIRPLTLNLPTG